MKALALVAFDNHNATPVCEMASGDEPVVTNVAEVTTSEITWEALESDNEPSSELQMGCRVTMKHGETGWCVGLRDEDEEYDRVGLYVFVRLDNWVFQPKWVQDSAFNRMIMVDYSTVGNHWREGTHVKFNYDLTTTRTPDHHAEVEGSIVMVKTIMVCEGW